MSRYRSVRSVDSGFLKLKNDSTWGPEDLAAAKVAEKKLAYADTLFHGRCRMLP